MINSFDIFRIRISGRGRYRIFHNVKLLNDCNGYIAGTRFETATVCLEIRGWNSNDDQQINTYL